MAVFGILGDHIRTGISAVEKGVQAMSLSQFFDFLAKFNLFTFCQTKILQTILYLWILALKSNHKNISFRKKKKIYKKNRQQDELTLRLANSISGTFRLAGQSDSLAAQLRSVCFRCGKVSKFCRP